MPHLKHAADLSSTRLAATRQRRHAKTVAGKWVMSRGHAGRVVTITGSIIAAPSSDVVETIVTSTGLQNGPIVSPSLCVEYSSYEVSVKLAKLMFCPRGGRVTGKTVIIVESTATNGLFMEKR